MNLTDYHVHCDYSADAEGSIRQYCRAAIQRGLVEICFTTHYDTNPDSDAIDCFIRIDGVEYRTTPELLARYVEDVQKAHDEYFPQGLMVKLGVEIGWWDGAADVAAELRDMYPLDYVLCGIHDVGDICICSRKVDKHLGLISAEELVEEYFREAVRAANTGMFDTIAHLAYYRRYGTRYYGEHIEKLHEPYLDEFFEACRRSDTGIEINTSAIGHGLDQYYPQLSIVNTAKKAGVRVERLGSDAHRPHQIGLDFDAAAPLVAEYVPYIDE